MNALTRTIHGAGGGGGGGSQHTPVEAPNTLQSRAYGVIMDIISAGPIQGFVDGAKSVLLQGVPLQDAEGNSAFNGVSYALMLGAPSQSPILGFNGNDPSDPGYTVTVNTEVSVALGPVTRVVGDANATSALVVINVPQLVQTNTSNGDMNPTSVSFQISTRTGGVGGFGVVVDDTISGKTTSVYQRQYRITRPTGAGDWEIKVTRTTADSGSVSLVNETWWATYTVLYDNLMEYPNTAYCMIQFDAALFGSSIPTRQYEVYGREIAIPSNYDPITRVYTGIWDGTFVTAWTDNPAWVWYDLVTNEWFGAGEVIDASTVDKWALYSISQYCDELVPDGSGGYEPRFTFNGVLDRPEDGLRALQIIAAMFDSVVYASGSSVTLVQDSNPDPIRLVTQANVENGNFNYQGTALSTRPTAVRAMFIDPNDQWSPSVEVVDDGDLVATHGYQAHEIQLVGVTSRGQASRKAANTIDLSWTSSEIVSFTAGLDMIDLNPGDLLLIADPLYAGIRLAGRCAINCTTTVVNLDQPLTLEIGETYVLYTSTADASIEWRDVTTTSDDLEHTSLTVSPAFSAAPTVDSVWLVAASNAEPRPFRVLTATEKTLASVEITAVFYDTARHDRVELGIRTTPPSFSVLPDILGTTPLEAPTDMVITENLSGVGNTTIVRVDVGWTPPTDPRVGSYQLEAVNADGAGTSLVTRVNSGVFEAIPAGTYTIRVRSVSQIGGQVSPWLSEALVVIDGISDAPDAPTALAATGGIQTVQLTWTAAAQRDIAFYEIQRAPDSGGSAGTYADIGHTQATRYVDAQTTTLLPSTTWWYRVRAKSTTGVAGSYTSGVNATTLKIVTGQMNDSSVGSNNLATQSVTQTSSAVDLSPDFTSDGDYHEILNCSVTTSTYSKVVIMLSIVPEGGGGGYFGGGGGTEGSSGGEGI